MALSNLRLAAAAGDVQRHLRAATAESLSRATLDPIVAPLWSFMPAETPDANAVAA